MNQDKKQRRRALWVLAFSGALAAIGFAAAAAFIHERSGARPMYAVLAVLGVVLAIAKSREANALRS